MAEHEKMTPQKRIELAAMMKAVKDVQDMHGISEKGSICSWQPYDDDKLVVEADGLGGATLMRASDHYPFDGYDLLNHHEFDSEKEACEALDWFYNDGNGRDDMTATEFFDLLDEGKKPWEDEDEVPA